MEDPGDLVDMEDLGDLVDMEDPEGLEDQGGLEIHLGPPVRSPGLPWLQVPEGRVEWAVRRQSRLRDPRASRVLLPAMHRRRRPRRARARPQARARPPLRIWVSRRASRKATA